MDQADIEQFIQSDAWMMQVLVTAQQLRLPDWMVGAGFVRNRVWDVLHGYPKQTPLNDLDVIYFDPDARNVSTELDYEQVLRARLDLPWSVKNQARMHLRNGDAPYTSSTDAVAHWPEIATCIAATLDAHGLIRVVAPLGIDDLVGLRVRPNPHFTQDPEVYEQRVRVKRWQEQWPRLMVEQNRTIVAER